MEIIANILNFFLCCIGLLGMLGILTTFVIHIDVLLQEDELNGIIMEHVKAKVQLIAMISITSFIGVIAINSFSG